MCEQCFGSMVLPLAWVALLAALRYAQFSAHQCLCDQGIASWFALGVGSFVSTGTPQQSVIS